MSENKVKVSLHGPDLSLIARHYYESGRIDFEVKITNTSLDIYMDLHKMEAFVPDSYLLLEEFVEVSPSKIPNELDKKLLVELEKKYNLEGEYPLEDILLNIKGFFEDFQKCGFDKEYYWIADFTDTHDATGALLFDMVFQKRLIKR